MTECLQKKYFSQSKNWISRIKFAEARQKNALRTSYCNMYSYAANNPVHYIDPDGRKTFQVFILNSNAQASLINKLSDIKNNVDSTDLISMLGSHISIIPFPGSSYFSTASTMTSTIAKLVGNMPNNFIACFNDTLITALKNYHDGRLFDKNCTLELTFCTKEVYAGKQDDFATVWDTLQKNPSAKRKDLPDKYTTEYTVSIRWQDENGKTLGGVNLKLNNKAEYDVLRSLVISSGGINEN